MATTETITFDLDVDARKANAGIAQVRDEVTKTTGPMGQLWQSLNTVDGKTLSVGEQFKALQQKLGPAAAAISGVSAALGQNAGEAGRAVAAAGQLAAAYGSGGPLGVAVVGMTLLVNQLQKSWDDTIAAQDRAIASANAGTDRAAAMRNRVEADIASLRQQVNGPESPQQARQRVQNEIDDVQRQRDAIVAQRNALKVGTDGYDEARARFESERKILEGVLDRLQLKQGLAGAAAGMRATGTGSGGAVGSGTPSLARIGAYDALDDADQALVAQNRAEEVRLASIQDFYSAVGDTDAEYLANIEAREARITQLVKDGNEQRRAMAIEEGQFYAEITMASASIVVAGAQQLWSDLITGQEKVGERYAVLVMQQAGQSLISSGIKLLGEATVSAFTPGGQGIAVGQAAAGAGLIGGGIALGGIAAGVEHTMINGGQLGRPIEDARTSTGVNRGSGGRNKSGGPSSINVTIVYAGASGPTADQGAKAAAEAINRAGKRGIT